jgi:hypothetical protein
MCYAGLLPDMGFYCENIESYIGNLYGEAWLYYWRRGSTITRFLYFQHHTLKSQCHQNLRPYIRKGYPFGRGRVGK